MELIWLAIPIVCISIVFFVFGILQCFEKGFLFNNVYIYATPAERKRIYKKPYYHQSGVVFLLLGVVFLLEALDLLLLTDWMVYCIIGLVVGVMIFAVVSTVIIEKRRRLGFYEETK